MSEDDFTPKLGRIGGKDGKHALSYGGRVLVAARLAGVKGRPSASRFDGSRIGRGAGIGLLLSSRDRLAGFRARRAIVKTRLVRLSGKGLAASRAHLRYIERDGVTRTGEPGEAYGCDTDAADGTAFLSRSAGDRHQFRFIVSAEDGAQYRDLKPYIRRLMTQAEQDLGTRLDWIAVDHYNTGHPHTHIMLRGVDERGGNLVIAREYIAHGLRERAAELAMIDLGPRTDREIQDRLRHDIDQERLTAIDRGLIRRINADRVTRPAHHDPFQQAIAIERLRKLSAMGLAEEIGAGRWRLAQDIEQTLRAMGERGDIIRLMQRELTARRLDRAPADRIIASAIGQPIIGRVISRGLADEHHDRQYLLVDGIDGRTHYVDIGHAGATEPTPEGAIVCLNARPAAVREVDRTIVAVAQANRGYYSIDGHLRHDPGASHDFAEAHVRRLEAMRRGRAGLVREPDGRWPIAPDHLARVIDHETALSANRPVAVEILSARPLERLPSFEGATWLDRELIAPHALPIRDAGFGRAVRDALAARRQWLVEQQLATREGQGYRIASNALADLQRRELARTADTLRAELGKDFRETRHGDRVEGRLRRRIDLTSGRFALVERARDFTLVPWRQVLEKRLGKPVTGIMRTDGVSWRFGRDRDGPGFDPLR
ncbi:MAG TPA: relaxase/mobilization nuclease RlxS [Sphingomonas sp.]|nr:relaxase/mobilization nuclease RlxS [Sphingomonas sp.]